MKTNESYYLVMVCAAFSVFGLALATNYIRYRRFLKEQARRGDVQKLVLGPAAEHAFIEGSDLVRQS